MYGVVFNQKHDSVFSKTGIRVAFNILKSSHRVFDKKFVLDISLNNIPHIEKYDLVVGGIVINVPHMYGTMKNHRILVNGPRKPIWEFIMMITICRTFYLTC